MMLAFFMARDGEGWESPLPIFQNPSYPSLFQTTAANDFP
jgi:hypothetical protein